MRARARGEFSSLLLLALLLSSPLESLAQAPKDFLSAARVGQHIGEQATVCGTVVSATHAARSRGRPTFLNLDRPYADHVFTIVIWGESRCGTCGTDLALYQGLLPEHSPESGPVGFMSIRVYLSYVNQRS